jgi:hypothetical protein
MRGSLFGMAPLQETLAPQPGGYSFTDEKGGTVDTEQSAESRSEEEEDQPQDAESRGEADDQEDGGADSASEKTETTDSSDDDSSDDDKTEAERESEEVQQKVKELEENPPEKLEDWPQDEAKYETFGGPEGEHGYHEGPEQKLGPASLRHHEDGSVEIEGEKVDDPEEYKGEPVPGGPTDPDTPQTRMDKAAPEDRSDVAKEAAGEEEGESSEEDDDSGEDEDSED